jgi:hypothetical protein
MIGRSATRATTMKAWLNRRIVFLAATAVVAAGAIWLAFPNFAETQPQLSLNTAVADPVDISSESKDGPSPATHLIALPDAAELNRVSLSHQSFRRGGLGSRALMTFTVRNANDYAVKDLEILCAFRSRDGHYITERRRVIADTVNMKSRKAFPMTHIGFINVRAEKAKCSLITASRA